MITEYKSALYRISYQGVSMIENALGNPNLIQISVVLGCSIIVSPQQGGGIQYLPNGESRKWFLYGANTKLNKTGHHFIYARLNRDGDQAYLIFSVNDYAIDGTINGENPSQVYYYVKVGEITETDALEGATKQRKITFDYGKYQTDETREGNFWQLRADSQGNEYITTKYPVLSQGAFTQYATLDPVVPSIFEGIPYDNQTIWFNPATQRVEVIGGTGGGEAGSVKWVNITGKPTWIGDTKPTYNWSEIQGEKPFYTKEEIASKYVTIDTEQEITALKHFTAGLSVGESKKKIYEENGVVYIDADVAVTGAMTFYASAGRSVSTIMDGVTVDEETITKGSDNVLRIKNAGAGSSFDENAMWSALSGSSDNQINKSHLTNALAGYATESWVTGKEYATESWVASKNYATTEALNAVSNKLNDFLEGSDADTIINKWKELEAFLSGMAETDNLAEILETKADKKYVDSTFVTLATKQTITGEKTFSSVLNTAAIKASGAITAPSLAVSDWVTIAGIKLRKLEDGALMLEGNLALTGALTMYASNGQSFDTIYDGLPIDNDTIYWQEVDGSRVLKAREGSGSSFDKSAMWTALAGSTTEQINKSHLTTALTGYATESWVSGKNYAVKATTLAGYGITDGVNDVSVTGTGNAVTAASISGHTLTLTKGSTFSLSGHKHAWADITSGKPTTLSGYGITDAYTKTESDNKYPTKAGSGASGTWSISVTGNAGSASKLQTTHTIWGKDFNGTQNISGEISTCTRIRNSKDNSLYLGNSDNTGWVYTQDIASHNGVENWAIGITGTAWFQKVNIGYAHPATGNYLLNVNGVISCSAYTGNYIRIECDDNGSNLQLKSAEINNFRSPLYLQHSSSFNLICCKGGGKVGIGTTSPTHKLTVEGNTKFLNVETHYGIGTDETGISSSAYYDISTPTIPAYKYRYVLGWQDNTTEGYATGYGIGVYRSATKWGSMILEVLNYENKTRRAQLEIRGHDNVLWFSGDILAEGGGTFYGSDIRYKTIVQHVQLLSLNKIAEAPSFLYRWNRPNMNQNRLNLGGSAQYTQSVLPWAVEDNSNFLMMDYATVAYTFAVHTARHLLTYETRTDKKIKKLENRVKYLEKQLKKLGYEEVRTLDDSGI